MNIKISYYHTSFSRAFVRGAMSLCATFVIGSMASEILHAESRFSAERITAAARTYLLEAEDAESEITFIRKISDEVFMENGVSAEFRVDKQFPNGSGVLAVDFRQSSRILRTVQVPFSRKYFISVPVLTRRMKAGEIISQSDVRAESRTVQSLQESMSVEEVIGQKLKRAYAQGAILTKADVESRAAVSRGQLVEVVLNTGSVQIRTLGRAMNDARPGETVSVQRDGARGPIHGVLSEKGIVEIRRPAGFDEISAQEE